MSFTMRQNDRDECTCSVVVKDETRFSGCTMSWNNMTETFLRLETISIEDTSANDTYEPAMALVEL